MNTTVGRVTQEALHKNEGMARVLARWLKARGLSPAEGAPLLGVSHQTVYTWLEGGLPPKSRIPGLAVALGVPEDRLRRVIRRDRAARKRAAAEQTVPERA